MALTAPTRIPAAVRRAASSVANAGSPEPLRMSTVAGAPCSDPSLQPVVGVGGVTVGGGLDGGGVVCGSCGAVDSGGVVEGGEVGVGGGVDDGGEVGGDGRDG